MTVEAILLGSAQDAGIPQAGCYCENCQAVRDGSAPRGYATSLALVDHAAGASWLIDATPDFREQFALLRELAPGCGLRGIVLTHAHMGHYAGLVNLGREAMNTRLLPVYASASMGRFLRHNGPWSQLFELGNIALCELSPGSTLDVTPSLSLEPVPVPHRQEYSDTLSFVVRGPQRSLFHCPDIDDWSVWERSLPEVLAGVDVALLDGTFYDRDELPGRDMAEVPHPLITDTLARLEGVATEVVLVHLNHANPVLHEGPARDAVLAAGVTTGDTGQRFSLGAAQAEDAA